jgi:hypothetical protein
MLEANVVPRKYARIALVATCVAWGVALICAGFAFSQGELLSLALAGTVMTQSVAIIALIPEDRVK